MDDSEKIPKRAIPCIDCDASGEDKEDGGECISCQGAGFYFPPPVSEAEQNAQIEAAARHALKRLKRPAE